MDTVRETGTKVRLLSAGYILNKSPYREIANKCDEIEAEVRHIDNDALHKYQRPIPGIELEQYVENIVEFRKQYKGRFIVEAALFRGINDSDEQIMDVKAIIDRIGPDHVIVVEFTEPEKVYKAFGVGEEKVREAYRLFNGF